MEVESDAEDVIEVANLDFRWETGKPFVLKDLCMKIKKGTRTLLIGANGAGKSSLLRILAGKHFHSPSKVRMLGRPAFHDTSLQLDVAYLGERWGYETMADVSVKNLTDALENCTPERVAQLMNALEIEEDWRIFRLSDGQRRRVQLMLGLARESKILLLDEVTTDLDLVARRNLLTFLREECEQRGVTIVYATHILDGLEDWATHLVYLTEGSIKVQSALPELEELNTLRASKVSSPLLRLVFAWLRAEFEKQRAYLLLHPAEKKEDTWGQGERTVNTGYSRGSLIPTPLSYDVAQPGVEKVKTQAQLDREAWQFAHSGTATVSNDSDESAFMPYAGSRLGFNKTNPIKDR